MTEQACRTANDKRTIFIRRGCGLDQSDAVYTVMGGGMSPLFNDNDYVAVEFTDTLEPGAIGVFLAEGKQAVIRQYYPDGLRSFRPDLETMHLNAPASEYPIIGKVLGVVTEAMMLSPAEEARLLKSIKETKFEGEELSNG